LWQHYDRATVLYGARYMRANRAVGLGSSSVLLPNQMLFVLMPVLGLLAAGPWRRDRQRVALAAAGLALAAAAYFSYTRSALIAIGAGLLVLGLCARGKPRAILLLAVLGGLVGYLTLQGTGLIGARYYADASDDSSAVTHQALWEVGLAVARDHPIIGIGHENFEEVSADYADVLTTDASGATDASAIAGDRPHNDFLSVWISWGIVALVAYLGIFLGAIRNCLIAARSHDVLIRGLAIGCIAALVAYAANSAFHNYLDSSVALWLYAGFSVALARLAAAPPRGARARREGLRRGAARAAPYRER
ncbi:MAG TPA: O-antigen ligase family protein, partial [Thermomicrobiales bacterium]|nr:O-antigen ligase family protein [Thermomicrobiales bacterium]